MPKIINRLRSLKDKFNLFYTILFILLALLVVNRIAFKKTIYRADALGAKNQNITIQNEASSSSSSKITTNINKEYVFPVKNDQGLETAKLTWNFESAEIKNDIIIKGQNANAAPGRSFLILNFKLKNDQKKEVPINTRDYVRFSIGNSNEWIAPDIHNDPVYVQGISTKYTRLAFPIDENDRKFKLQIGGLDDEKSFVELNF